MTLGELIARLEHELPDKVVADGFGRPHSWRGIYAELAFDPAMNVTVGSMLAHARSALGETFTGWKGGDYKMDKYTDCHIAYDGDYNGDEDALTVRRLDAMLGAPPSQADRNAEIVEALVGMREDVVTATHDTPGGYGTRLSVIKRVLALIDRVPR